MNGLVSIVVIGRNEGTRLGRCLESLAGMVREGFATETIYVDSGSTDGSVSIARGMGAAVIALAAQRPTAAMGRNAGWRAARGDIVLFLDGDTVLAPRFVAESLGEFGDGKVAVVWGHRREISPSCSLYNRVLDLDWMYAPGWTEFCGGDALFRRHVLAGAGGFDETLMAGEEPELCRRILGMGYKILHVDRAMTGHDLAMTRFGQYWRRAARAGHAYAEVAERFRGTKNPFWLGETRRNRVRALGLVGLVCVGAAWSVAARTFWPMLAVIFLLSGLALRTAWKARWKSRDWMTLLLYGVHSQFQQIPIYWGQMRFRRDRRAGRRPGLVEYKEG
jgi:glycosyltransferase involved in cell wall biosynthesis